MRRWQGRCASSTSMRHPGETMARFGIEWQRQREHRKDLAHRAIPEARKRWIIRVSLTAIPMRDWAAKRRIPGLVFSDCIVWLRPRDAMFLIHRDKEAGGNPLWVESEFRKCRICARPLLNLEAELRRELDESRMTGRQIPCGAECLDAQKDKRWKAKTNKPE